MKFRTVLRSFLGLALSFALGASLDAKAHFGNVIDGVLTNIHGDPMPRLELPAKRIFNVIADDGHIVPVDLSRTVMPEGGVNAALNRRVRITADVGVAAQTLPVGVKFIANTLQIVNPDVQFNADVFPVAGNRVYVSLLCKWAGDASEPRAPAFFQTQLGASYPGFNHYFQEVSYGAANITGSTAMTVWVNMPHARTFYDTGVDDGSYLHDMAQDCVTAAESQVNFTGVAGVNMMFNGLVDDCCAWGGSDFLTIEGVNRLVSVTWMPYWGALFAGETFGWLEHGVLAHELSHSFGSPHSDGPGGYQYNNQWDVVSRPGGPCTVVDGTYGCIGQHQVANNKLTMGFIAGGRIATHAVGTGPTSYNIERMALPPNAGGTFQVLKVMTANTHKYYTVESRLRTSYDQNIPGDGVIIHEVIDNRVHFPGGNPNLPGDPALLLRPDGLTSPPLDNNLGGIGARWSVGQAYTNVADNIKITVSSFDAGTGTANVTVAPASAPGEFNFAVTSTEVTEGGTQVNIAVTRGSPFTGTGSVVWTTSDGTAIAGTDFGTTGVHTQKTGPLTWTAGTGGVKNITVGLASSNIPVINDTNIEAVKSFGITLSAPVGGVLGANTTHTVNINDSDSTIAFDGGAASVSEAGPNITVTLTRTGSTTLAQAVTYATTAGTATATSDYTTTTGSITFAVGETSKVITIGPTVVAAPFIRIINDALVEGPETFNVNLSAPTNGAALGAPASMTVTINSDEKGVSMATASRPFTEGDGAQTITVNRSGAASTDLDVSYSFANGTAQNGSHFVGVNGTLHWDALDATPKFIPVTINDDGAPNTARTFTVTLSGATNATTIATPTTTGTIADNDNTVQFTVASATVTEGTANLVLTVSRTGVSAGQSASVTWTAIDGTAHLGTDFGGPGTGTVTFAAGVTTAPPINIPIINDLLPNGARTFSVALSSPVGPNLSIGNNSNVAVTLNDNEKVLQFEFPTYSVTELTNPNVTIRVQRSGPTTTAATATWATVNGTATAGQDFGTNGSTTQRSGSLSWAIGDAAAKTITIPILNDSIGGEGDETFTVTLTPGTGYVLGPNAVATVTIHDNDIDPETNVQFTQPKYIVMENGLNVVLTVTRTNIGVPSLLTSQVTYATVPGTALATSDYTTKTGTLNWGIGDFAPKDITIAIVNNTTPEPPESFKVTLSGNNPGTAVGTPGEATVLILDDDEVFPLDGAMPAGFTTPVGATKGWHVSNDPGAYDGVFSLKSDEIDDSETAGLQMAGTFAAGNVRFYVKVSTEPTFDTLQFFIDGVLQATWSGTASTAWQISASYPVSAAHHTLSWVYTKDGSASVGMDAVYLDGLTTPAFVPDP